MLTVLSFLIVFLASGLFVHKLLIKYVIILADGMSIAIYSLWLIVVNILVVKNIIILLIVVLFSCSFHLNKSGFFFILKTIVII